LAQVLRQLPEIKDPRLLVGHATFDDAGVFRLTADLALVQTIDFFPPVIDDPYLFGQVAAANSLSDIYAMGGEPLTALSLVCFPNKDLDLSILADILRGGGDKCVEAGCTIVGGHSVSDPEIKFGLAVTGTIHPDRITSNDGARPGDLLFLTKPLGMGILTTAYRKRAVSDAVMKAAVQQMAALNKGAAAAMRTVGVVHTQGETGVSAATDITGFGLLGHARNVALASNVTLVFRSAALPLFDGALELAGQRMNSGAYKANQELLDGLVALPQHFDERIHRVIYDAETSGGLLICVSPEKAGALVAELKKNQVHCVAEVGSIEMRGEALLKLI